MKNIKLLIENFYQEFFNNHDISAAEKYVKEDYIQHNLGVPQGRNGLMNAFSEKFKSEPDFHLDIQMIVVENDIAAVYLHNTDENLKIKAKVVDIYRIEDNMLAEHWDIIQKA